jgi:tetratricopeptide (TPR) repeat protein
MSLPAVFIALLLGRIKLRRLGVRMMELALKCEPRQAGIRLEIAKLQFIIGRKKDSVRSFLEVTRLRPDDTEAYTVLEKMVLSYDVHENDLESVRQIVREEGDSFWAHMFMGLTLEGQSEIASFSFITGEGTIKAEEATSLENALESSQEAIRLRPESSLAYLKLADCLKGLERFERALENYEKAHQLDPVLREARLRWEYAWKG